MPCKMNHEEAEEVGQDKGKKDYTEKYDEECGHYEVSKGGKPTSAGPGKMPNEPSPMRLGK